MIEVNFFFSALTTTRFVNFVIILVGLMALNSRIGWILTRHLESVDCSSITTMVGSVGYSLTF